jgi:Flp pilus assembly protein TadB
LGLKWEADPLREKERSMNEHERPVVTEANKTAVRAGSTGHNVRYVLIASCALVIIAFIAIALFVKP